MEKIKEKSGILTWSEENIKNIPESLGVFILRSSPLNGAVISIETSINLRKDLLEHFENKTFPDVEFFDWYVTENKDDADSIKKEWDSKYGLIDRNS